MDLGPEQACSHLQADPSVVHLCTGLVLGASLTHPFWWHLRVRHCIAQCVQGRGPSPPSALWAKH